MLFRKKIERCCSYCKNGTELAYEMVLCCKKGLVSAGGGCRKFSYDPCKRIPPKPKAPDFEKYNAEHYSL